MHYFASEMVKNVTLLCLRPYLQAGKREALADYSLPVAVITLSFVGSYLFQDVTGAHC